MRVLLVSTQNEPCGIADYQARYLAALESVGDLELTLFPVSPNVMRTLRGRQLRESMALLAEHVESSDLVHVQHEFGLYRETDVLKRLVRIVRRAGRGLVVTLHSPFSEMQRPTPFKLRPRSILYWRYARRWNRHVRKWHLDPVAEADRVIVHNDGARDELLALGLDPAQVVRLTHPIPDAETVQSTSEIARRLRRGSNVVVIGMLGFINPTKGFAHAVRALHSLPGNYKLAVIGGLAATAPQSDLDELMGLVASLGVQDRFHLTGYIADERTMNALIRECDVIVMPYAKAGYNLVSSGALSQALACNRPVIGYPTRALQEVAAEGAIAVTRSFDHDELARTLREADLEQLRSGAKLYSERYGYGRQAEKLAGIYQAALTSGGAD